MKFLYLAERIEREGKVYPVLYNGGGEYTIINLDNYGSIFIGEKLQM